MGFDWIVAGGSCIGFSVPFETVFKDSGHITFDELLPEDYRKEGENYIDHVYYPEGDNSDDDAEDKKETIEGTRTVNNCFTFVNKAWSDFISKNHPNVVKNEITLIIGCTSIPGSYEKKIYASDCVVVFGYEVKISPVTENGEFDCHLPECKFPSELPTIIRDFIAHLRLEHALKRQSTKKARYENDDDDDDDDDNDNVVKVSKRPKVVTFVE
jgi:hypothetical protein